MASPEMHRDLDEFMRQKPPRDLVTALESFITKPLPTVHSITWIPPADEVAIRKELANRLCQNLTASFPSRRSSFSAVQVATLFIMPLKRLEEAVELTDPSLRRGMAASVQTYGLLQGLDSLQDLVRYFLQGQHPDAATKKRKSPGNKPQPIETSASSRDVLGMDYVLRNDQQKNKCLTRDQHACIFTDSVHPQAYHIVPYAFNSNKKNLNDYTVRFTGCMAMFFNLDTESDTCAELIGKGLGCSDKCWNMLSINPHVHGLWARPYWAIQNRGVEPRPTGYAVILAFHWMPHRRGQPDQEINVEPGSDDVERMMDGLRAGRFYGEGPGESGMHGSANILQHDSFRPIVSGQVFEVTHDTLEDAHKMRMMVEIQWACIRIAAMSGAAGPGDSSDDFSEFDFERAAFTREAELGDADLDFGD